VGNFDEVARKYFDKTVTERERAIFEGAITLGAIYHQFIGTPICKDEKIIKALETAIEKTMRLQPYKEKIKVRIDINAVKGSKRDQHDYEVLEGRHMNVEVKSSYGGVTATLRMRYIPELNYSLMYVEKVEKS
jgi:hypothetical protein